MTIKSFYIADDGTAYVPMEVNTPPAKVVLCGSNAEASKMCLQYEANHVTSVKQKDNGAD